MTKGLPSVEQKFIIDIHVYVEGIKEMIESNKDLIVSIKDTQRQISEMKASFDSIKDSITVVRDLKTSVDEARRSLGDFSGEAKNVSAANDGMGKSFEGVSKRIMDNANAADALYNKYANMGDAARKVTKAQDEMAESFLSQMAAAGDGVDTYENVGGVLDSLASRYGVLGRALREHEASQDRQIAQLVRLRSEIIRTGEAVARGSIFAAPFVGSTGGVADRGVQYGRGYVGENVGGQAIAQAIAAQRMVADAERRIGVLQGAATGAIGGGIGGLGGYFGGGGRAGDFPAGSAALAFANVASFIGRYWQAAHWMVMLGSELAATAGPAVVAAGAAGLVGYQGGQQLFNRYQALNAVAESLGPTGGFSLGTLLGTGNGLQQIQNQYGSGEAYGLAGAGINALKAGAGGGFLTLGQKTMQMLDAAAAHFDLAVQGGMAKALGGIVQGGSAYLQTFGNIAGNVGKTIMNIAPNVPGVGAMLLSALQSGTGGLADVTKALGPGLLPILGFEAGARWGPALIGGAGALAQALPFGLGGKLPLKARAATAADVAAGRAASVGDFAPAEAGSGLAGILGGMTAPEIGLLAVSALAIGKTITGKTAAQQQYGALASNMTIANAVSSLSQIATAGVPGGVAQSRAPGAKFGPFQTAPGTLPGLSNAAFENAGAQIGKAWWDMTFKQGGQGLGDLVTGHWSKALHSLGNMWQDLTSPSGVLHGLGQLIGVLPPPPTAGQAAFEQMGKAFGTWTNVLGASGQVKSLWKDMGGGALSTSQALDVLAQSGVNVNTAFDKNHQLTALATQELKNYQAGYQAVTGAASGGAGTLAAINAVAAAGGLTASKVSTVNSAMDQLVGITSGGAAGTAALAGLSKAVGTGVAAALTATAPPTASKKQIGEALASFTSPAGIAAWAAFASTTQPSVVSQLQQQADNLRNMQVLGGLGGGAYSGASMFKYLLGSQGIPAAGGNAAALAMLSQIAQPFGGPVFTPGESAKTMEKQLEQFAKSGDTQKQYNAALTVATEKVSALPSDAKQFVTAASSNFQQALAAGIDTYGQQAQSNFISSFAGGKGPTKAQIQSYAGLLHTAGFSAAAGGDVAAYAAQVGGASPGMIKKIAQAITEQITVDVTPHVEKPGAGQLKLTGQVSWTDAIKKLGTQHAGGVIHWTSVLPPMPNPVTTGTIVWRSVLSNPSGGFLPTPTGRQQGFRVPGYGGGDTFPALLEGGEAVVPKHLVPQIAPFLAANRVPGFAAGGLLAVSGSSPLGLFESGAANAINNLAITVNALSQAIIGSGFSTSVQKIFGGFAKTQQSDNIWGEFGRQIMLGLIEGIKNSKGETTKMAQALVNSVVQEVTYGKNIAAAAKQGTGFNPWGGGQTLLGTFGNFATPTTTAQGQPYQYYIDQAAAAGGQPLSVQQQMGDYLQALKSFSGDISKLGKQGLNKNLLQQLLAAGPLAGDQMAQSILSGAGGAKGANQLWGQINQAANQLGITGAGTVSGGKGLSIGVNASTGPIHALQAAIDGLHGKTVTVVVNVVGSGGGGGGGGHVNGTPAHAVKQTERAIQSHLLTEAKNNRRTGLVLPGYGG